MRFLTLRTWIMAVCRNRTIVKKYRLNVNYDQS